MVNIALFSRFAICSIILLNYFLLSYFYYSSRSPCCLHLFYLCFLYFSSSELFFWSLHCTGSNKTLKGVERYCLVNIVIVILIIVQLYEDIMSTLYLHMGFIQAIYELKLGPYSLQELEKKRKTSNNLFTIFFLFILLLYSSLIIQRKALLSMQFICWWSSNSARKFK